LKFWDLGNAEAVMACARWAKVLQLCFLVGLAGFLARVAAEEALPELDIVVTTKVTPATIPQDHTDALKRVLQKDAREIFFRLVSRNAPLPSAGPAKDGAAKYRLFLDHATSINCGIQFSMKVEKVTNVGGDYSIRRWYLPFDQKASYAARLAKWTGEKYVDVVKFGGPVHKNDKEIRDAGAAQVAEQSHRAGMDGKASDVCPIPLDEARKTALRNSLPPTLRSSMYSRLVPVTLLKATPTKMDGAKPSEMMVELKIENKAPWQLKRAEFAFSQGGFGFMAGDEKGMPGNQSFSLPKPLETGQSATVKVVAKVHQGGLPQGTQNAEFATETP
jgi:hypothetical protein